MLIAFCAAVFSIPFDIYYWIKWIVTYVAIRVYIGTHNRRFDLYHPNAIGDPEKLGFLIPQIEADLESPFSESHLQEGADEVFFYGVNSDSECLMVRITRGCNQAAEAWIYLKLANGKTYHLTKHEGYEQPFEGKCMSFSCGNLQMHYLTPMRRWRIYYCGPLKECSDNKEMSDGVVFVKFVFLYAASSDVYDATLDTNLHGFTNAVARSEWKTPFCPPINKLAGIMNFYSQTGNIRGTVSVNDEPEYEMHLFGEKFRNMGNSSSVAGCNFQNLFGYVPQHGLGIHLTKASLPNLCKNLPAGFIVDPSGDLHIVKQLDITIKPFSSVKASRYFHADFTADKAYDISGSILQEPILLYSGQGWSGFVEFFFVTFTIMDKTGYGILMSGEVYNEPKNTPILAERVLYPKSVPFTVKFTDDISHFGNISGGKGSSLGKLTKLSKTDKTFVVPKGIIVSTSAYDAFLNEDIMQAVKNLENIAYGNTKGDVKGACDVVSKKCLSAALPNKICQNIIQDLKFVFGEEFRNIKFAVRSSATGEDTDVMSAAGQMDTFLGVQGLQEVFLAVKKCWASQFGHIAVEYKKQNGQPINSPMAVVVQEMVNCDVAGVLFTCDPVNNNPSVITITANYGLGETVVSGSVEPDTIMLHRTLNDHLKIKSVDIGSKHQKIVMKESGGTVTEDLSDDSKAHTCITEETALTLGKLAINVERFYRSSRDIEWGIKNKKIYLLQSRPVTSGAAVTDFEIKHEFDTTLRSERDYYTMANVGEVLPGATSPLGFEIVSKYFTSALAKNAFDNGGVDAFAKSKYYDSGMQRFYCQMMMSVPEIVCREGHGTMASKGMMISIFGRILEEPEIYEIARERIEDAPKTLRSDLTFLKDLFCYDWGLEKTKKNVLNYDFPFLQCKTAQDTFDALMRSCSDFFDAAIYHMICSTSSSHWNNIVFLILTKAKGRFDTDVYSDFGRILATSSNLESADIPSSTQKLANQIRNDLGAEKFKAMTLEEAENWLNDSKTEAGLQYRQFIKRHGHRCLREFDIRSIPWGQDQKRFIKLLQTLTGCTKETTEKSDESYSKIFSELKVPLNFLNRLLLRFVIPMCRKGVRSREATKSLSVKSADNWRKGFQHLATLMVSEGRIPDPDLIYFMSLYELDTLLKTRFPKIISRAIQRRKMYPTLDEYKFPEIMRGFPKPINEEDDSLDPIDYNADLTMQGIPVSQGVIKGYARVATSLEQAASLKPGEILIAYSTDIGWSPYFPIISGVVTELGGLISHGNIKYL